MEESLSLYLREEELCRLSCDKPFDMGWYTDFTSSTANHFTFCLKCRVNCPDQLNNLNGEVMDDLVASFYHYLQFGYYKMGEVGKAAEAAASFLHILPDHQDMLGNLDYYQTVEGVRNIQPREEAVEYMEREEDEHSLLDYITDNFVFSESEDNEIEEDNEHEEHNSVKDNTTQEEDLEGDEFIAKVGSRLW